ncbi:MAG: carboxypeptidase regulatory-like domain-containing protein [Blastocatellia bacterium]
MDRLMPAAKLIATLLVLSSICLSFRLAAAQTPQSDARPSTASIGGRVTVSGKPAHNLSVTIVELDGTGRSEAYRRESDGTIKEPLRRKVSTDAEGRYRFLNLPAGTYRISPELHTTPLASAGSSAEKTITIDDGESRDDLNLAFIRGGVITGRVTDANGKPLIAAWIMVCIVREISGGAETQHQYEIRREGHEEMYQTDDRGIYRIYGLPKGRYIVSSGDSGHLNPTLSDLPRVWHPGVSEQKQARLLEIDDGVEIADVDIRLSETKETYEATGRVVDAETGAAIPSAYVNCQKTDGATLEDNKSANSPTDTQGRFRLTGLTSGTYEIAYSNPDPGNQHYLERTSFVIAGRNLEGLELKAKRGATISGAVVFEGKPDQATWDRLKESIGFVVDQKQGEEQIGRGFGQGKLDADGKFRVSGLPPGLAYFQESNWPAQPWQLTRIEHNGADARDGIEVGAGQKIDGVRIVYAEGKGLIRGIVKVTGGLLPENVEIEVFAAPSGEDESKWYSGVRYTRTDGRGRFALEGLLPREYELSVWMIQQLGDRNSKIIYARRPEQRVTAGNGAEANVTINIDYSRIEREGRQ